MKNFKLLPSLLLILLFMLRNSFQDIPYEITITIITVIAIISTYIFYNMYKSNNIKKDKVYVFLFFILFTLFCTLLYINKIEN